MAAATDAWVAEMSDLDGLDAEIDDAVAAGDGAAMARLVAARTERTEQMMSRLRQEWNKP